MIDERKNTTGPGSLEYLREVLLVDGKYIPSSRELGEKLKLIDLVVIFKDTDVKISHGGLIFSFDSFSKARLFLAVIKSAGLKNELFSVGADAPFFNEELLHSYRVDGASLSSSEDEVGGRLEVMFYINNIKYVDGDRVRKYEDLVREVVVKTIPQLSEKVEGFRFS